jgi:hypothetical protein
MNAPGKGLLKVVSILLIIAGAFAVITSIIGAAGSALLTYLEIQSGNTLTAAMIISAIIGILEIIFGILGIKRCAIPAQGQFFLVSGIILCATQLSNMIVHAISSGFPQVAGLLGFVLPVLYVVGGLMNKRSVVSNAYNKNEGV